MRRWQDGVRNMLRVKLIRGSKIKEGLPALEQFLNKYYTWGPCRATWNQVKEEGSQASWHNQISSVSLMLWILDKTPLQSINSLSVPMKLWNIKLCRALCPGGQVTKEWHNSVYLELTSSFFVVYNWNSTDPTLECTLMHTLRLLRKAWTSLKKANGNHVR